MENPYESPPILSESTRQAPRIRVLAIVLGWLTDIAFTIVAGFAVGLVAAVVMLRKGVPADQFQQVWSEQAWVPSLELMLGVCGSILGGFVAGKLGKERPIVHALAAGLLSIVSALPMLWFIPSQQPLTNTLAAYGITVPAAVLGGFLAGRSRQQR